MQDPFESQASTATDMAEEFTAKFGYGPWGRTAMSLVTEKNPHRNNEGYLAAASAAYVKYGAAGKIMANPIAAIHSTLLDSDMLDSKLNKHLTDNKDTQTAKLLLSCGNINRFQPYDLHHLQRMLFSCLTDADFLSSEKESDQSIRNRRQTLSELLATLRENLARKKNPLKTQMGKKADSLLQLLTVPVPSMDKEQRLWSLTPPHDSNNIIPSVIWALTNAERLHKERIIIAAPYTSSLINTANMLKSIFGDVNVTEHRMDLNYETETTTREEMLGTRNWDSPIIVTSCVKLFNAMYANTATQCRRLHNLCNSFIILEELQTLPVNQLYPVVDAIRCYSERFGTAFVFAGSFAPVLENDISNSDESEIICGLGHIREIIPDTMRQENLNDNIALLADGEYDVTELANEIIRHKRVLCILNTRRTALELYEAIEDKEGLFHLSGNMCPSHIASTMNMIKESIDGNGPVRVISTTVMETRQNLIFPYVLREKAGLDSMIRAARLCCLKERKKGKMRMFSLCDKKPTDEIRHAIDACESTLYGKVNPFDPKLIVIYFKKMYHYSKSFDVDSIEVFLQDNTNPQHILFEKATKHFSLYRNILIHVLVSYRKGSELICLLAAGLRSKELQLKMLNYSINLYPGRLSALMAKKIIVDISKSEDEKIYVVENDKYYDTVTGLKD